MNRRESIKILGLISGHALFSGVLGNFITSCQSERVEQYERLFFDEKEYSILTEVIDLIIPKTETKSASEVGAQEFLDSVFHLCLGKEQRIKLKSALSSFLIDFSKQTKKLEFLVDTDKNAFEGDEKLDFFKTLKRYTMIGFFTSQEGETKANNYDKFPGEYKGEITIDSKTKSWGNTNLHYHF